MLRGGALVSDQQALGFLVSQLSYIESQVVQVRYPDIQYSQLIPVDTSAPEWSKSITYYSGDRTGKANWFHHMAKDIHVADVDRSKNEVGVEMADIGYRYSIEEISQAIQLGMNLPVEKAAAAVRASEEFIDTVALQGNTEKGFSGLISYPGITIVHAAHGAAAGGHTTWDTKTADELIKDVNDLITGQYTATKTVEIADTLLLPVGGLTILATKRLDNTDVSVLDYLKTKNVYTLMTGQPLTIRAVRGLETAGTNGSGRAVAYRRDPQVLKMHMPMPHRFLQPWQTAPLVWDVPGIFRLAGLEIRRPGAVRYLDGILTADSAS
jgi:hypothetical protein